jgi:CII-binding regulator of phage lambda lysogenization HflD
MATQFDAIRYAQQLEAAGVPKPQAEVHARTLAHVVSDFVAGPADLLAVKNELSQAIAGTEVRLRTEIQSAGASLREEIHAVDAKLHSVESGLREHIHAVEASLREDIHAVDTTLHSVESSLREEIHAVESRLNRRIDKLEQALKFQQWTQGAILALLAGLYVQLYFR